jgi:hypothetical protein
MAMRNLLIIVSMVGCAMLLSCGGNSRADNEDQAARKAERAATQFVYGTDDGEFKSRSYFEKKLSSGEIKLFNNKVEELVEDIYDDADDFAESIASAEDVDDMRGIMGDVNDYAEKLSPEMSARFKERVSLEIDNLIRGE